MLKLLSVITLTSQKDGKSSTRDLRLLKNLDMLLTELAPSSGTVLLVSLSSPTSPRVVMEYWRKSSRRPETAPFR